MYLVTGVGKQTSRPKYTSKQTNNRWTGAYHSAPGVQSTGYAQLPVTRNERLQEAGCHSDRNTTERTIQKSTGVQGGGYPRTHLLPQLVDNNRGILWEPLVQSLFYITVRGDRDVVTERCNNIFKTEPTEAQ